MNNYVINVITKITIKKKFKEKEIQSYYTKLIIKKKHEKY